MELVFHYPWWIALLAMPPALLFAMLMARGQPGMARPLRLGLAALRAAALMLIVLLLLEPALRVPRQTTIRSRLPVLIDVSQSMAVRDARKRTVDLVEAAAALDKLPWPAPDEEPGPDPRAYADYFSTKEKREEVSAAQRRALVKSVLDHPSMRVFDRLAESHGLRFHLFADHDEAVPPGEQLLAAIDRGLPRADAATQLGRALESVLTRYAGYPLSGVVLLTDGASNQGPDPEQVARRLGEQNIPLYTVGVGLAEPNDILIRNLIARDVLFTKDIVTIKARIASSGYENRTVSLRASLDGAEVASKTLVLTGEPQLEQLTFQAPQVPGRALLDVEVSPLAGEAAADNNTVSRNVRFIDEKMKVLYIEGSPRWEYRYLRSILKRDRRLDVRFMMTEGDAALGRASPDHIESFPDAAADAFAYDLVIIGDVRASELEPEQIDLIERLVRERGGTLLMIAGEDHAPADYADTPLAAMLPVRLEEGVQQEISRHVHPVVTPAGRQSMVMLVDSPHSRNDTRWSIVKPLGSMPRLAGAKPGAVVLAELSEPVYGLGSYPLIAWHRYGTGKVMFVGTDRLWRLRYKVGDEHHTRFWVQTVQFLGLSRLLGENKRVRIETDQTAYHLGEAVHITVDAVDEAYEPLDAPSFGVELAAEDGPFRAPLTLKPAPGATGLFHTVHVPTEPGRYIVKPEGDRVGEANLAEFDVRAVNAEQRETAMRDGLLRRMAEASGGQHFRLLDLPKLAETIKPRDRTTTVVEEHALWNTWAILALFLALAGGEWFLRRQNGLA